VRSEAIYARPAVASEPSTLSSAIFLIPSAPSISDTPWRGDMFKHPLWPTILVCVHSRRPDVAARRRTSLPLHDFRSATTSTRPIMQFPARRPARATEASPRPAARAIAPQHRREFFRRGRRKAGVGSVILSVDHERRFSRSGYFARRSSGFRRAAGAGRWTAFAPDRFLDAGCRRRPNARFARQEAGRRPTADLEHHEYVRYWPAMSADRQRRSQAARMPGRGYSHDYPGLAGRRAFRRCCWDANVSID